MASGLTYVRALGTNCRPLRIAPAPANALIVTTGATNPTAGEKLHHIHYHISWRANLESDITAHRVLFFSAEQRQRQPVKGAGERARDSLFCRTVRDQNPRFSLRGL